VQTPEPEVRLARSPGTPRSDPPAPRSAIWPRTTWSPSSPEIHQDGTQCRPGGDPDAVPAEIQTNIAILGIASLASWLSQRVPVGSLSGLGLAHPRHARMPAP